MIPAAAARDITATHSAVAAYITERLAAKDITTEEFAREIPLGHAALENRLYWNTPFSLSELAHIANALGMTTFELFARAAMSLEDTLDAPLPEARIATDEEFEAALYEAQRRGWAMQGA